MYVYIYAYTHKFTATYHRYHTIVVFPKEGTTVQQFNNSCHSPSYEGMFFSSSFYIFFYVHVTAGSSLTFILITSSCCSKLKLLVLH